MPLPSLDAFFTQSDQFSKIEKPRFSNTPEFNDPIWLDIEGEIPTWLKGILYRIGPGKFILNEQEVESGKSIAITHAFDGLSYVHRFEFDGTNQKLRYNSRQTSKDYEKEVMENPLGGHGSFGTFFKSNVSSWERFMDFLKRLSKGKLSKLSPSARSINVTITPNYPLPNSLSFKKDGFDLVAKTDIPILQKVHHDTLEPEKLFEYADYDKRLDGRFSASHHQQDKITGDVFNFTMSLGQRPKLTVFKIDSTDSKTTILAEITHQSDGVTPFKPAYVHAFWITQNYVIVPISPCHTKNHGLDIGITGVLLSGLEWDEKAPTVFYVVDRHHGKGLVATIPVDNHFAFHTLHGRDYVDENGDVVLELNTQAFEEGDVLFEASGFGTIGRADQIADRQHQSNLAENAPVKINGFKINSKHNFSNTFGNLRRYKVLLKENQQHEASYTTLVKNIEFARIHPDFQFESYQYVYYNSVLPGIPNERGEQYCLKKADLKTGQEIAWTPDTNDAYICSEPVFISRPSATEEDDGVVISLVNVYDNRGKEHDRCYLLFLNAKDYSEYGRVQLGKFTATTFHGSFVDSHGLDGSFN